MAGPASKLTRAEEAVLELRSEGLSDLEIAQRIGTSPHVVREMYLRINLKLGAKTKSHALALWAKTRNPFRK